MIFGGKILIKERKNEILNFQIFKINKKNMSTIDRNLKTASVAVSKSMEHDVTLTQFVADLSYPVLSNFYIMCEIVAREGAGSFALICSFV